MLIKPRQNLFEFYRVLQEAPGDDANDIMNTNIDQTTTNTDPGNTDNQDAGEAESSKDDDLDIDVDLNLDDPGTGGEADNNNDDNSDSNENNDLDSTTDASSSSSTDQSGSEEVKKGNTDMFSSLTAEEQSIKIMELKRLYNDLYTTLDDLLDKLSDISLEDIDPRIIVRITSQMEELKRILQDYIINVFGNKTYYENDVQYSIFLNMFTTLRGVFDEIFKNKEQNRDKQS